MRNITEQVEWLPMSVCLPKPKRGRPKTTGATKTFLSFSIDTELAQEAKKFAFSMDQSFSKFMSQAVEEMLEKSRQHCIETYQG